MIIIPREFATVYFAHYYLQFHETYSNEILLIKNHTLKCTTFWWEVVVVVVVFVIGGRGGGGGGGATPYWMEPYMTTQITTYSMT